MPYPYQNLSSSDFESLATDILSAKLGVQFERFGEGPDGGVDCRYRSTDGQLWIGQAKRHADAKALLRKLAAERKKMEKLKPTRYFLVTSCALTPRIKDDMCKALTPFIQNTGDILGRDDLDALIGSHDHVLRRHFKLWINDAAQINAVLHNGLHQRSHAAVHRILEEAKHFVSGP